MRDPDKDGWCTPNVDVVNAGVLDTFLGIIYITHKHRAYKGMSHFGYVGRVTSNYPLREGGSMNVSLRKFQQTPFGTYLEVVYKRISFRNRWLRVRDFHHASSFNEASIKRIGMEFGLVGVWDMKSEIIQEKQEILDVLRMIYFSKKVTTHPWSTPGQSPYPTMKGFPLQPVGKSFWGCVLKVCSNNLSLPEVVILQTSHVIIFSPGAN